MTLNMKSEPTKLVEEYLEIAAVADDIGPSAYLITDDIAYTLSPSGHVFRGAKAMAVFAKTTGGERTHDAGYKINITNWFADDGHLCIEYTHGFNSLFRLPIKVRNAAGICLVFHIRRASSTAYTEYIDPGGAFKSLLGVSLYASWSGRSEQNAAGCRSNIKQQ